MAKYSELWLDCFEVMERIKRILETKNLPMQVQNGAGQAKDSKAGE